MAPAAEVVALSLWIPMYGTNFKPQIFTDITISDIKFYSPHTGKKSQVLNPSNYGLISLDITGFLMLRILSIYHNNHFLVVCGDSSYSIPGWQ